MSEVVFSLHSRRLIKRKISNHGSSKAHFQNYNEVSICAGVCSSGTGRADVSYERWRGRRGGGGVERRVLELAEVPLWGQSKVFANKGPLTRMWPRDWIAYVFSNYITCKKFPTLKIRTFSFGRLIFGHFFSHSGQISDKNFGQFAETCLK